jgi:hypothetical protein
LARLGSAALSIARLLLGLRNPTLVLASSSVSLRWLWIACLPTSGRLRQRCGHVCLWMDVCVYVCVYVYVYVCVYVCVYLCVPHGECVCGVRFL